tara:strand:+ start:3533 stop:3706 length:174 start_codon:yes stop_codon:yes gene_type:complete
MRSPEFPVGVIYLLISVGAVAYNAYQHNFQLGALWIIITLQTLALGNISNQQQNKND